MTGNLKIIMFLAYRPSRCTHASRALTALITVWCLGCSAFDPLLSRLAGRDAGTGMVCAADDGMDGAVRLRGEAGAATAGAIVTADDAGRQETAFCDCQSCCAPAPTPMPIGPLTLPMAAIDLREPLAVPLPKPEPLVPPPQVAL
jgi:hypothetical protein